MSMGPKAGQSGSIELEQKVKNSKFQVVLLVGVLGLSSSIAYGAKLQQIEGLGSTVSTTTPKEVEPPKLKNLSKEGSESYFGETGVERAEAEETLAALNDLNEADLPKIKKQQIRFQQASLHYNIALSEKQRRSGAGVKTVREKSELSKAMDILSVLVTDSSFPKGKRAFAFYLKALVHAEMGEVAAERVSLEKSIYLEPRSEQAIGISLLLGEIYFEEGQFVKAQKSYLANYNKLQLKQRNLVDYKLAWCAALLNRNDEAIEKFRAIALDASADPSPFQKDSLRDAAYVSTLAKSEEAIISLSRTFKKSEFQGEYLYHVLRYFFYRKTKLFKENIFRSLLTMNLASDRRLSLLSLYLESARTPAPGPHYRKAVEFLESDLANSGIQYSSLIFKENSRELEITHEFFIKQYLDMLLGKIPNPKSLARSTMLSEISFHSRFHLSAFPDSKFRLSVFQIGLDAASDISSAELDFYASYLEVWKPAEPIYTNLRRRIEYEAIVAQSKSTDPQYLTSVEFIEQIGKFLREKNPKQRDSFLSVDEELKLRERLFQGYYGQKNFEKAKQVANETYLQKATEENLFNLYAAYFQLGDYKAITDNQGINASLHSSKIKDLVRESFLRMAQKQGSPQGATEFSVYESNILAFIKSTEDKTKKRAAILDYLTKAEQNKGGVYVMDIWAGLSSEDRSAPEFEPFRLKKIAKGIESGEVTSTKVYLEPVTSSNLAFFRILVDSFGNKDFVTFEHSLVGKLSPSQADYFRRVEALTAPAHMTRYFLRKSNPLTPDEERLLYLTLQVESGQDEPNVAPEFRGKFKVMALKPKFSDPTLLEKLNAVDLLPVDANGKKLSDDKYNKKAEKAVQAVASMRKTLGISLPKYPAEDRPAILRKAAQVEKGLYAYIMASPIPAEITGEEKQNYRDQISGLAQVYSKKGDEYLKLAQQLEGQLQVRSEKVEQEYLPPLREDSWLEAISEASTLNVFEKSGFRAGILHLDYLRSQKKSDEKYWATRTLMIYRSNKSNRFLRKLMKTELVNNQQISLVTQWGQHKVQ